jgi:FlaA1/EpsC-like NDP-sugar epimerase
MFKDKIILITGGTGSFGNAFLDVILKKYKFNTISCRLLRFIFKIFM